MLPNSVSYCHAKPFKVLAGGFCHCDLRLCCSVGAFRPNSCPPNRNSQRSIFRPETTIRGATTWWPTPSATPGYCVMCSADVTPMSAADCGVRRRRQCRRALRDEACTKRSKAGTELEPLWIGCARGGDGGVVGLFGGFCQGLFYGLW